jgi:hypothetical protein
MLMNSHLEEHSFTLSCVSGFISDVNAKRGAVPVLLIRKYLTSVTAFFQTLSSSGVTFPSYAC